MSVETISFSVGSVKISAVAVESVIAALTREWTSSFRYLRPNSFMFSGLMVTPATVMLLSVAKRASIVEYIVS